MTPYFSIILVAMGVPDGVVVLLSMFVVAALGTAGFYFIPKSAEQLVHRTALVMTLVCCWLMWVITFMAQMHPIIRPERTWGHDVIHP
ncbi:hypothetical protein SeMB42_g02737 [Synchytrium endobioticum]|uniref:V-type proton ATPase subunit e n=1 Tax=Synchytrium endobioticum TaxID=286115 RepID=A0A507CV93_9FUNG|nr:hypothetical protein SeLEV6574_g05253 [Synchytrium endobioticum]TPX49110.1 hypothetical protein SeMB42_g02737 [Synchytrium endobioticum]